MRTSPEPRRWPAGFSANPARFLASAQPWRAVCHASALAALAVPLVLSAILLLPWIPLVAGVADRVAVTGARWMGVAVPHRQPRRLLDLPRLLDLLGQLVLALVSIATLPILGIAAAFAVVVPFASLGDAAGTQIALGLWSTSWPPAVFATSWALAVLLSALVVYIAWTIAGLSTAMVVATHTPSKDEILRLERSRATLIDAFTGERSRIERELHDGVQQYLTALQLNIATAQLRARSARGGGGDRSGPRDHAAVRDATGSTEHTGSRHDVAPRGHADRNGHADPSSHADPSDLDAHAIHEALDQAQANAGRALEALRSTIRGIYPQVLADKGLVEALRELVAHSGISGELFEGPGRSAAATARLRATPALLLYHCAAEGITNAVRHGGASRVELRLAAAGEEITLLVDDDGAGNIEANQQSAGTGLAGLRERAHALGGTLDIDPNGRLGGARLRIALPLDAGPGRALPTRHNDEEAR